jgi:hypothetical protein
MGGLTGGLFKLFEGTGLIFFAFCLGKNLAQRDGLGILREIIGGALWGSLVGILIGLFNNNPLLGLEWGAGAGILLSLVLLGLTAMVETHEENARKAAYAEQQRIARELKQEQERQQKEQQIASLQVQERQRIQQAKKKGVALDPEDEKRRVHLVNLGVDPDDPHAVATAAPVGAGCCLIVLTVGLGAAGSAIWSTERVAAMVVRLLHNG